MTLRRYALVLALLVLPLAASSCAEMPKSPEARADAEAVNDPLEPMNRVFFDVNDFLDRLLIRPLTELYRFAVPDFARERVANIVANMGEPVTFANNLLQGETGKAGVTAQRFLTNSTLGGLGMFEVAEGWGLPAQDGDFGQTLSVWGINGGPYLVLPLFGPSNFRDGIGMGVDSVMSPWQYAAQAYSTGAHDRLVISYAGAQGLGKREANLEGYDALRAGSLDFYAQMRSVYRQYRNNQLGLIDPAAKPHFEED